MSFRSYKSYLSAFILAALVIGGNRTAPALAANSDFTRYQVILDKKPFGEVTPSETQPTQAALSEVITKELELKAIVDDGNGIMRVGFLDKKSNKNFFLGVGENLDDLQVVSINYDNEEAVIKKGSETAVIKLHPDKDQAKTNATMLAQPGAGATPFQPPVPFATGASEAGTRKPFFADLKRRQMSPFKPLGTNTLPFQGKPLDFFKVTTGSFPKAQSPFGPFQASQGNAAPMGFQHLGSGASNAPNPFLPVSQPNAVIDSKGATIDQLMQAAPSDQNQQVVPPVIPTEGDVLAE